MRIALWASVTVIAYAYIGYPLLIWALARWAGKRSAAAPVSPAVSILLCVRNGMTHLPQKMAHLFSLDYPGIEEIIVVSDGSSDGAAEYLATLTDPRLKIFVLKEHGGKAAALNVAMQAATAETLLFVDIRPRIAPGAIQSLMNHFADPRVGCVSGELVLLQGEHNAIPAAVGGLYWRYEQWIRKSEARFDSPVGVYGGFYAIRRALAVPQPAGIILDDMFEPLAVIRQGYRSVIEPEARVYDEWPGKTHAEFKRKVRTLAGNFQLVRMAPWILTRENRVVFQLVSHKILRLFVPYLLLLAFAATLLLAPGSRFYAVFAGLQLLGLLLAAISAWVRIPVVDRIGSPIAALLVLNAAAVVGFYRFLATREALWKIWDPAAPPGRQESDAGAATQQDFSASSGWIQSTSGVISRHATKGDIQ